ncbi:MAG: beta-lactamase family protein [Haliscomenobacter sp.]|nr:beta-lactamase family protein [Haliscomenobacter sp.]
MKNGIIISVLLFAFLQGYSQCIDLERGKEIDSIVNRYVKEYSIVGLSVGIVHGDETYSKHYGLTDQKNGYQITDSTLFLTSSISKLFTATAIFQLIEENKLTLEDRLIDILTDFRMKDKRYTDIRIKHLLTHSSGLKWDNKLKESPDDSTSIELFLQNLRKQKLNFTPGEKMSYKTYSNAGYDLLGIVVERISSMKFSDYIKANILDPLQMNQSTYYYENIDSAVLAIPQIVAGNSRRVKRLNFFGIDNKNRPILNGEPLSLTSYCIYGEEFEHNPSGNLISSAVELNFWMQHNLKIYTDSTFNSILTRATLKEMWATQIEIPDKKTSIGWGWWIHQDEELGKSVFHVGTNTGFCSILMIYPEKKFGLTILCNGWYAQEAVWHKIAEEITALYIKN